MRQKVLWSAGVLAAVATAPLGSPTSRNNLARRHFKPLARRAGLPEDATLYTLRHTFATLWLESKELVKVLQEILGTRAST